MKFQLIAKKPNIIPMQLPIQGQWWSKRATQRSHTEQCFDRTGRRTKHPEQNSADSNPLPPRSDNSMIVYKYFNIASIRLLKIKTPEWNLREIVAPVLVWLRLDRRATLSKSNTKVCHWTAEIELWLRLKRWAQCIRAKSHRTKVSLPYKRSAATMSSNDRRTLFCRWCVRLHTDRQVGIIWL